MTRRDGAVSRRRFLRLGILGAMAWTASACGTARPGGVGSDQATPTAMPSATPAGAGAPKILRNENREGFYIRYYQPFPAVDANAWRLQVTGQVERPTALTLEELLALPRASMDARMKCVECWSARATWDGFPYQALVDLVGPTDGARFVRLDCADEYWEIIPIEDMMHPRAMFVTHMNGALLPDEYGAPLRIMLPWKYGYKSAKAITSITFTDEGGPGYWSSVGPYTIAGDIQAGIDHPLDVEGERIRNIAGGEITEY